MRVRLGLIGPADSIERIVQTASRMSETTEIIPRIYSVKEESAELAAQLEPLVDVILFSGIVPYRIAALANAVSKPMLYLPRVGMSLALPLWEMREKGQPFRRISIDSFAAQDIAEVAEELGFSFERVEIIEQWESATYEEMAEAHERLYRQGLTDVALTGLSKTVQILAGHGTPCKRVYPTRYTIREYLEKAIYIGQNTRLRAYQTAVLIVQLRHEATLASTEYDYLQIRNTFERMLIEYARGVFGSMFPFGHNEYLVFTTRGAAEEPFWLSSLYTASGKAGIQFCAGLGFGTTTYNAEANARKALDRSRSWNGSSVYSVDVDGEIHGPLEVAERGSYNIAETDASIMEAARSTGLSPAHLSRIRSLVRVRGHKRIDVDELATSLNVSSRSARRILQELSDAGKARVVALESRTQAGRPRRLYEIDL